MIDNGISDTRLTVRDNRKRDLHDCLYQFQYISFGIPYFHKTNTKMFH